MDLALGSAAATTAVLFGVGIGFGVVAERTAFCTMGAIADVVLFGGWRRARSWAAAIATAALALQLAALAGWVTPGTGVAWRAQAPWLAALGGVVFGAGMVCAGGCVSRAWVRTASGSVKGLAVVLAAAAGIAVSVPAMPLADPAVPTAAAPNPLLGLVVTLGLALWVLRDARFRTARGPLASASAIGGLVALAVLAHPAGASDGIRFVVPFASAFEGAVGAGLAVVAGTVVGAGVSAAANGRFRGERWAGAGDILRHVGGGVAMGVGGTLALGCTVGAGITGAATMAPAAWLALAGMAAGATLALKVMLAGGPTGAWRLVRRRLAGGT
jgi:hypothetical protein